MILHVAEVAKAEHWSDHCEQIIASMRIRMTEAAEDKSLDLTDMEIVEITPMRFEERDDQVGYFSCDFDDATHIKVQIEREVEHR